MNIESVKSLFTLFSGECDSEKHSPIITLSMMEVEKMLLPEINENDIRLDFLSAAIANHRLQQINSARDRTQVTYAGKMVSDNSKSSLEYSERMLKDYIQLCEDLIRPRAFMFMSFSYGGDL